MTDRGGSLVRNLALLAATLLLAMVPGATTRVGAALALALFFPGYALLHCLRAPTPPASVSNLLHCGAASLAITPLVLRLAGILLPFDRRTVLGILVLLPAFGLALGAYRPRPATPVRRRAVPTAFYAILFLTLLLLIPTLAIGPTADGSETRVKGWDLNNHLSVAEAIASRGLPPTNPFIASDSPFYYHTFFHILLGAILVISGPGAPAYLLIALLTILIAAIFLETFRRVATELSGNERAARFALLFVTFLGGFDILPILVRAFHHGEGGSLAHLLQRHWNVDAWVSNRGMYVPIYFADFYWVPHAVASLVVFLLALLFLRKTETGLGAIGVAGACLASMAGYNGYIALGGASTLALLRGADLLRLVASRFRSSREVLWRSGLAGGTAVILGWPVLSLYVGERGDVDKFRWARPGPLLPLQILLEFGPALVLGFLGVAAARRRPEGRAELMPFILMGAVGLPLICLVASTGENNDLAMRLSMFVWVSLAVFAGLTLDRMFPSESGERRPRRIARILTGLILAPGLASVAWFVTGASLEKPRLPADEVAAGRWVRAHIPAGLYVQASPLRSSPEIVYLTGHPAVLSDTWAAQLFYSVPGDYSRRMGRLQEAFSSSDPSVACPILRSLKIAALVVGPPEATAFPPLARPIPWPCLTTAFTRGTYRVYRLLPEPLLPS